MFRRSNFDMCKKIQKFNDISALFFPIPPYLCSAGSHIVLVYSCLPQCYADLVNEMKYAKHVEVTLFTILVERGVFGTNNHLFETFS